MRKPRSSARSHLPREAAQLVWLSTGLSRSGGKLEDAYWEPRLASAVDELLRDDNEADLTAALDQLFEADGPAHDELADMVESRAESTRLNHDGKAWDVLLVACPVLAWSRFSIPAAPLSAETLGALKAQLAGHVLAKNAKVALANFLFSPDQLPRSFCETFQITCELGVRALTGRDFKLNAKDLPETNRFLSDTRYLLAAVAVPQGEALFRWNEPDGDKDKALAQWIAQAGPTVETLLPGCAFQPQLPDAYHAACRQTDQASRPYSLRAAIAFLQTTVNLEPAAMKAVIGPFHDQRLEEYRIGIGPRDSDDIYYGVVWPLLGTEDDNAEVVPEIEAILAEAGFQDVTIHDHRFPLEFCDDCGSPLYPNKEGELVHAEMPEQPAHGAAGGMLH